VKCIGLPYYEPGTADEENALTWNPCQRCGRRTILGWRDGVDPAICVEGQLVDATERRKELPVREFARVIEHVPLALELDDRAVLRDARGVLHHLAGIGEWSHRVIADGIDLRGGLCPAIGIHEIVFSRAFEDERSFAVAFGQDGIFSRRRQWNRLALRVQKRNGLKFAGQLGERGTELHHLRLTAAKIQIRLAVIVLKHGGIDRLRPRLRRQVAVNQRLSDGILERPFRLVAHRHADLRAIHRQKKVVLAVRLHAIRRPRPAGRPGEILHAKDRAVVLPRD
jgi:hypothetical protein